LLEFRSFDVCKNTVASIIAMLDYWKLDIEVLDVGIETMESNNCKRMSRNDGDANGVLAAT